MTQTLILGAALLLVALLLLRSLLRRDKDRASAINLEALLLGDDGKMSKAAFVMLGAFIVTTWLMIYLAISDKMTEGYLAIYVGAWIAPTVTRLLNPPPAEAKP